MKQSIARFSVHDHARHPSTKAKVAEAKAAVRRRYAEQLAQGMSLIERLKLEWQIRAEMKREAAKHLPSREAL